jgi:hypothetical protein
LSVGRTGSRCSFATLASMSPLWGESRGQSPREKEKMKDRLRRTQCESSYGSRTSSRAILRPTNNFDEPRQEWKQGRRLASAIHSRQFQASCPRFSLFFLPRAFYTYKDSYPSREGRGCYAYQLDSLPLACTFKFVYSLLK